MTAKSGIIFSDDHGCVDDVKGCFTGFIAPGISSVPQLMSAIRDALLFPAYFGSNWNALSDCLRDFHWIKERDVFLVHTEMPCLQPEDLKTYLGVLEDAVDDWREGEEHVFLVVFPVSGAETIGHLTPSSSI